MDKKLGVIGTVVALVYTIFSILIALLSGDGETASLLLASVGIVCIILALLSFKKNKLLALISIGIAIIALIISSHIKTTYDTNGDKKVDTTNNTISTTSNTINATNSTINATNNTVNGSAETETHLNNNYFVGDIFSFGTYEQDNNIENGAEELKWKIIDKKDNELLIITTSAIDCQPYNATKIDITWESCSLRKWLNGTFYNAAFSPEEQRQVLTTHVTADSNPRYNTTPGSDTYDKVFALSLYEVEQYFAGDSNRQCSPTPYAVGNGAYQNEYGNCWWWLRSPGESAHDAASVNSDGTIDYDDGTVSSTKGAVRPVIWIRLEQGQNLSKKIIVI